MGGQMRLEANGLLMMKRLEILEPHVALEPMKSLRHGVDGLLAVATRLLHIREIDTLDPLIRGVDRFHRFNLPSGVTIHGRGDPLSYAWRCIRECDFKIPLNRLDFRLVNPPVNKPVAIGTNAAKVAGRVRHRHKFSHVSGRCFWRSAWQTIDMAWQTGLLFGLATTLEKSHEHWPMKERRS